MNAADHDRLNSRLIDPSNISLGLAPVRPGEGARPATWPQRRSDGTGQRLTDSHEHG